MDRRGSSSSPDMFAPAMIPVAAGKKRAKRNHMSVPWKPVSGKPGKSPHIWGWCASSPVKTVAKTETSETTITARIRYWIRKAKPALTRAIPMMMP